MFKCRGCDVVKSSTAFTPRATKLGHAPRCKVCRATENKTYRANNSEKMRANSKRWRAAQTDDGRGKVYFIQTATGAVKIGWTKLTVVGRCRQLQTGSFEQLTILGWYYADRVEEITLHQQFRLVRVHGEWFQPHPGLLALIRQKTGG